MKDTSKTELIEENSLPKQRTGESEQSESKSRLTDANLKKSEEQYRNIFENSIEGIYQTTPEGRFTKANPSAARLLGYESPEDLINTVTDIGSQVYAYPEDRDRALKLLRKQGSFENFEVQCRKKDGTIVWGSLSSRLVRDDRGNILCIEGTSQDITNRKNLERTLKLHSQILLNMGEGVFLIRTDDGIIVYANPRCEHIFGYNPGELIGKHISVVNAQGGKTPAAVAEEITSTLKQRGSWNGEVQNIRKDGTPFWCYANVSTFDHPEYGQVWVAVHQDVTDRKSAEDALGESDQRLRYVTNNLPNAVVYQLTADSDGGRHFTYVSNGVERLNEVTAEEVLADAGVIYGQVLPEYVAMVKNREEEALKNVSAMHVEVLSCLPSGRLRWFEYTSTPRRQSDGLLVWDGIELDITDRKHAEEELAKYRDRLEQLVEERTYQLKGSEVKYRSIFENAVEGIFQSTPQGQFLSVNPAMATMCGFSSPEEMIESIKDTASQHFVHPEGRDMFKQHMKKHGVIRNLEYQIYRKDGSAIWVSTNARELKDNSGNVLYYEGTQEDITSRKEAEKALRQGKEELRIKSQTLQELNITLKVLLQQKIKDEKELEERFAMNVDQLVLPYVEKLKNGRLDAEQSLCLSIIESNLNEIASPFIHNIRQLNFTPREAQVASLVRNGKTTKEIAAIIGVASSAVDTYRNKIRSKLNLTNAKTNLQSYLQSLE